MENNPLLDISRISGRRGSKSTGRFLTKIKQMIQLKGNEMTFNFDREFQSMMQVNDLNTKCCHIWQIRWIKDQRSR